MSGLLDELLKEPEEPKTKEPVEIGKFQYSEAFSEYVKKDKPVVDGKNKDE